MTKNKQAALMPVEHITRSILVLRRQRVLLDRDLAEIYGVSTEPETSEHEIANCDLMLDRPPS